VSEQQGEVEVRLSDKPKAEVGCERAKSEVTSSADSEQRTFSATLHSSVCTCSTALQPWFEAKAWQDQGTVGSLFRSYVFGGARLLAGLNWFQPSI
jgi:hypothetical protein